MAVGIIIGAAFGGIINSLVNDVIMPPVGLLLGKVDFSNLFIDLSGKGFAALSEAKKAGAPVMAYGAFLNTIINFVILAFVIFGAASASAARPLNGSHTNGTNTTAIFVGGRPRPLSQEFSCWQPSGRGVL